MALRVLLFLLSLFILVNIVIVLVSVIFGVNLYKQHGKTIIKCFGIFILFIVAVYVIMAVSSLI